MLVMRLQRIGKKGQAYFRIVVTEHTKKPQGEFLELLGSYDPHKKDLKLKKDRVEYWQSKGVQLSPTVNNLLVNHKIISAPKMASWRPKVKEQEANKSEPKATTPAKEAAQETSAEPETPAEETPTPEEKPAE
jgi:small subunit ribosomal protein S16